MSAILRTKLIFLLAAATIAAGGDAAATAPALASTAHLQRVTSRTFKVTTSFPASWTKTPGFGGGSVSYDGSSGFIDLSAADGSLGLRQTCRNMATDNVLHPFGRHPHITFRKIDGRPGCVITPSADAPRTSRRHNGHKFRLAEALVAYRHAITIAHARYRLLVMYADSGHIKAIVDRVRLRH